jgi:glycosyltransferase involved in cell wall biosynthesis
LNDSKRIQEILDDCDVLVAPSYSEGMPNVIMEAMARGLTVIATPVGAIESIISKDNGWLIEPGDSSSLAKLILEITELDVASLNIKKESSLTIVNQLTWDKIATRTILTLRKQLTKED